MINLLCDFNCNSLVASGGPQSEQFGSQVDRLATLIDKLEGKVYIIICTCSFTVLCIFVLQVKLETVEEEEVAQGTNGTVGLVFLYQFQITMLM